MQDQEGVFRGWGGWGRGTLAPAILPALPVLFLPPHPHLPALLTRMLGFCFPLVVVFGMAQLSRVLYKSALIRNGRVPCVLS